MRGRNGLSTSLAQCPGRGGRSRECCGCRRHWEGGHIVHRVWFSLGLLLRRLFELARRKDGGCIQVANALVMACLKISAGVWWVNRLRGRLVGRFAAFLSSSSVIRYKLMPLGQYCRSRCPRSRCCPPARADAACNSTRQYFDHNPFCRAQVNAGRGGLLPAAWCLTLPTRPESRPALQSVLSLTERCIGNENLPPLPRSQ